MKRAMKSFLLAIAAITALSSIVGAQEPVAVERTVDAGFAWYDATQWPTENKAWTDVERYFSRLPKRAQGVVPDSVWGLAQHSAGEVVRFRTNANAIKLRYNLLSASLSMVHMPATGVSGFDLYAFDEEMGKWRWVECTRPHTKEAEVMWVDGMERKMRDFMAYLPMYNGVEGMTIGVPEDCEFTALSPRTDKPIVYYGTSIAHGGCTSRPGNAYTAIIGRRLDIPVVNLGFSGSGRMEIEMAELIAEIDAAVYVLDTAPNMNADMINERAVPFVKKLRETHPETPILLVEDRVYSDAWIVSGKMRGNIANQQALRKAYDELKSNDPNLYYLSAQNLIGDDLDNDATMDSSHLNDLGMYRQADALEAVLRPILEKK